MEHNEIMETGKLHSEGGSGDGRKKLLLIAALTSLLLAVAGAIYGAFRLGKKRGAQEAAKQRTAKRRKAGRVSGRNRHAAAGKSGVHESGRPEERSAAQPVYVVRPLQPKKKESRAKRFRRHLCAAAAVILVISMVGSSTLPYGETPTVLARESFSGIGRIVAEHESEPYTILDITAANAADSSSHTFNLGSMGYLVNGQSALQTELAKIFSDDLTSTGGVGGTGTAATKTYATYDKRQELFKNLTNSSDLVTYQEAYGGVSGMSTSGYTQIYAGDTAGAATGGTGTGTSTAVTGQSFYARIVENTSKTGNYNKAEGYAGIGGRFALPTYGYDAENGTLRITFKRAGVVPEVTNGYVVRVRGAMAENGQRTEFATDTTGVYLCGEDGTYSYVGTVAQLIGRTYTRVEDEQEQEQQPQQNTVTQSPQTPAEPTPEGDGNTEQDGDGNGGGEGDESGDGSEGETTPAPSEPATDPNPAPPEPTPDPNSAPPEPASAPGGNSEDNGSNSTGEGEPLISRALSMPGGWYLLAGLTPDGGEGQPGTTPPEQSADPGDGDGEPDTTPTTPPEQNTDPGDGDGGQGTTPTAPPEQSADPGDGDGGQGTTPTTPPEQSTDPGDGETQDSDGGGSFHYVASGPEDSEIDWSVYEDLAVCYFEPATGEEPAGTILYEVDSVEEIESGSGLPRPLDAYTRPTTGGAIMPIGGGTGLPGTAQNGMSTYGTAPIGGPWSPYGTSPSTTPAGYIYTPGTGDYDLVYVCGGDVVPAPSDTTLVLVQVQGAPVYVRCTTGDVLKDSVFSSLSGGDNESSGFSIQVVSKRADEVTVSDVADADLIFLEDGKNSPLSTTGTAGGSTLTAAYIGSGSTAGGGGTVGSSGADMAPDVMRRILLDAAEDLKPVIVEHDVATDEDHYKDSNYQYLARAFLKDDLAGFCAAMDEGSNFADNVKMNVSSGSYPDKTDNSYHYVNRNVYIVGSGTTLVSTGFATKFDGTNAKAGFSEVLDAISAENTTLSEENRISAEVSPARAVQYIINYAVGIVGDFGDLRILELQPSANRRSDLWQEGDDTKLVWKRDSVKTAKQILFSREAFRADIDTKSVVEFNGEWEDINGVYDIVFIGLDGQRLNRNGDGETRYNNEDLNGKVYHTGDSSGAGNYDANDITGQKMEDLLNYMKAGYPVLVEDDCFEDGSAKHADGGDINTTYIQEDSVMYRFLKAAVEDDQYENCIFTVSDVLSNSMFMTRVRLSKPRLELVDAEGNEAAVVQTLSRGEDDAYHGQLYYRVKNNRGEDYSGDAVVRVYADYNHDGSFVPAEEVTEYLNADNMLDVKIDGMGPGILPWKLEVSDSGNGYRRSSVLGYFQLDSEYTDDLKVLQITEKKGDPLYDLQQIYSKKKDSVLAHYLKGAEQIMNVKWQFDSLTPAQLAEKLAENANYLSQWDVVVLTLDGMAANDAVTEAIGRYTGEGRSLLVCGQEPDSQSQRAGLSGALLGQTDNRTYVDIGAGGADGYKRYDGLKADMYLGQTLLKAEPVNTGSISLYPYTIDGRFTFGERGLLRAAPYLLDFEDNLASEENVSYVTAWYTFGSDDPTGSAYGISPKDARNNYYCYSKGNVVYLAQSQYPYTCDETTGPAPDGEGVDESRFFVNALTAAYDAGLHNAHIHIVGGFSDDAADINSISVPFDETWTTDTVSFDEETGGIVGNTVDVYFKFRDNNFAPQKVSELGFYYEDPDGGEVDIGNDKVSATPFTSEVWTVTDNKLVKLQPGEELKPGKIYRIKAPVKTLQKTSPLTRGDAAQQEQANKADIYIVLQTSFTRGGRSYRITSSDAVSLNRTRLFLLE